MDMRSPPPDTLALEWLRETFPRVFRYHDKPLMIGVHKAVMAHPGVPFSSKVLRFALHRWTGHHRYLVELGMRDEAGEPVGRRFDLRGRAEARVSAEAAHAARQELYRRRQARQKRRA
jgi:sRNA-binding protein